MSNLRILRNCLTKTLHHLNAKNVKPVLRVSKTCRLLSTSTIGEPPLEKPDTSPIDTVIESLPLVINRHLKGIDNVNTDVMPIREVWLENMSSIESIKLSLVALHPSVWGEFPRVDFIQQNHKWQTLYKKIDWTWMPVREELSYNNRKPWPQKGTGRARARGIRAPQWKNGGWVHGPRGPKTYFYILPFDMRLRGLISMLSTKLAQDDLKVVDTLESLTSDKPEHIEQLCQERGWGPSVLFVDTTDLFPTNISIATNEINHINLMPVYGLNVFSMLKHETLVLTLAAVEDIENKLLFHLRRTDHREFNKKVRSSKVMVN